MKIINITSLFMVAVVSFLSNVEVTASEHSDEMKLFIKNLRHLGVGEKSVKGAAVKGEKKEKKVKGEMTEKKEKMPPKVKEESDKKKEKGVKGESNEKESQVKATKAPKENKPKETKDPSNVLASDFPSGAPTEVPV